MSIWAVSWALESDVPNPTHKLVLIALANFADDRDEAWPRVETLAAMASTSRRTVFRALESLEEAGLISRRRGMTAGGRGGMRRTSTVFRVHVPEEMVRRSGRRQKRPERVDEVSSANRSDASGTTISVKSEIPCQGRGDTGGTTIHGSDIHGTSGVTPVSPLYKEEPPLEPPTLPPYPPEAPTEPVPEKPGSVGSEEAIQGPCPGELGEKEAWRLIRSCLPAAMQPLDRGTAVRVAVELRARLDVGWTQRALRDVLSGNALPAEVHSLGGLVLHRVREIPLAGAPVKPLETVPTAPEPVGWYPQFLVERTRARLLGSRDATHTTAWWVEKFGCGPSDIRMGQPLETVLRDRLSAEQS